MSNDHEDQQHVSYQPDKEFDSTQKKQTHQNEVPLLERACSKWKVELGAL